MIPRDYTAGQADTTEGKEKFRRFLLGSGGCGGGRGRRRFQGGGQDEVAMRHEEGSKPGRSFIPAALGD